MASLFSSVVNIGKAALERIQQADNPCQVRQVNPTDLALVPACQREGCLVLYGPKKVKKGRTDNADAEPVIYEIVILSEKQSFSLFRASAKDEAENMFHILQGKIPSLLELDQTLCSQSYLQMMCDALRQNSSMTLMHLAVSFDLKAVVSSDVVIRLINVQDSNGITPLMLAVKKENIGVVKFLVSKGASVDKFDEGQDSVFHFAAATNKDIVEAVTADAPKDLLNVCNAAGDTPLHIACKNDKTDCVQAFLCAGADVNVTGTVDKEYPTHSGLKRSSSRCVKEIIQMYPKQLHTKDIKHGGTPLHWAKSREIVAALVDHGCLVDAKNFNGKSALHLMVEYERLDCAVALVTHGASIDLKTDDGDTALHLAVDAGSVSLVRALLVFEANPELTDAQGRTPAQLARQKAEETGIMDFKDREGVLYSFYAVGACFGEEDVGEDGSRHEAEFAKIRKTLSPQHKRVRCLFDEMLAQKAMRGSKPNPPRGGRLLSLDGGGIKGLVIARMLLSMEKFLGVPIIHCFDWIAGTSTGGILALALATGRTPLECQVLYFKLKDRVFVDSRPYASKNIDELLQQEFGLTAKMFDIKHPKLIITSTIADRTPPDLQLFRNYRSPQSLLGISDYDHPELSMSSRHAASAASEQLVWRAARASGAAPSFFRPEGKYIDGGILANNPSLDLLTEVAEYNAALKALDRGQDVVTPSVLVSLGTGVPPVRKTKVVDIFRPDSAQDTLKLFLNWDGMGKLMLDSVLDADGKVVDQTRAWCLAAGISFHRLCPYLLNDIELDEKDEKQLVDLLWTTMSYIYIKREEVLEMKPLLVC